MYPPKSLNDVLKRDGNNFDILRLIAAFAVIVGHAYAISPQPPLQDGVLSILHFDYSGSLAVKFFFFLSGLLVTNSIISKPDAFHFLIKRACRILPGLLVCLLVAVFIVGPLFTHLPLSEYFTNKATWSYITKNFFLRDLQWNLPGVFTKSKYGVNGSLWTLPYEAACYIYLAVFYGLGLLKNRIVSNLFFITVIVVALLAPNYLPAFFAQNPDAHLLPVCFAIGALFANNKGLINFNMAQLILIWLLVVLVKDSVVYQYIFYIAFFYTSIFISSTEFVKARLKLPFDASYGVYVYGFMVQQCIHALFPAMGVHGNQGLSFIIALFAGICSWYLIERRFIALGNKITDAAFKMTLKRRMGELFKNGLSGLQNGGLFVKNNFFVFVLLGLMAMIIHGLVLKFIFPGYYSPLYPQHSDFYIPAAFAHSPDTFLSLLSWPRPMNMIFAKFAGYFGIQGSIAWVIVITCMNCAMSALLIIRILKLSLNWRLVIAFAGYCYLLFSHPYFYTFYAQDMGAQLSYFFLIFGAYFYYLTYKRNPFFSHVILFCFCLLGFLSKETYGLAALVFALLWFIYTRRTSFLYAMLPGIMVGVALGIAFIINIFIKSAFVNLNASAADPYHINLSPGIFLKECLLYAGEGCNWANLIMILLLGYLVIKYRDSDKPVIVYIFIGCVIGAMASWIPNALLPNHHYKGYSFNGAYLLYLPILLFPLFWVKERWKNVLVILVIALGFISPRLNINKYKDNEWVLIQEDTQRNLLKALDPLMNGLKPSDSSQKILIQGITFPFHPFAFPQSLRVFPNAKFASFDVVNYNPGFPNNQRIDLVEFISPSDTNKVNYQEKWFFDQYGKLVKQENVTAEKLFDIEGEGGQIMGIDQDNFQLFSTSGFYSKENGIRWTNGHASIVLNPMLEAKDSMIIKLKAYLPPVCEKIFPELSMVDSDNKLHTSSFSVRKDNMFYYLFILDKKYNIQKVNISSDLIDASPDKRELSFPFVSLNIESK